ncbi:hypothetical protein PAXINDRAFT_13566 [Paxillus involutus ATCC 200175]|uniref:Uncharacterized protein n=1 Tax=Paxillus involutus ATCC 200175 TaxID=664439 RepID=A0A0C9TTP6_PAXIN|nr:hypothetical protein PAXINDRAFT_13566 [Paxillus involutus ATCC 200175]
MFTYALSPKPPSGCVWTGVAHAFASQPPSIRVWTWLANAISANASSRTVSKHRLHAISFPSILSPIPSPTDHQSKGFSNMPSTPGVPLNEFGDLFPTLPTKSLATLSEDSEDSASPIICINVPAVPSDEAVLPPCAKPLPKANIRARRDQLLDVLHLPEADKERAKDLWDEDPDSEIRESFNIIDEF